MHITKYINEIREKGFDNNITVKNLLGIIESQKTMCDNFWFNPTMMHARSIFSEICDWEVTNEK